MKGLRLSVVHGPNQGSLAVFQNMLSRAKQLKLEVHRLPSGTQILDCGVHVPGGVSAGLDFALLCMASKAKIQLSSGDTAVWPGPWVHVSTDFPVEACMWGQYAGWPVKHESFFAMGSGPMRVRRGKEELLKELNAQDPDKIAVGTLECDLLPTDEVACSMAQECQVAPEDLYLAIAPTRSIAGCVQVVARSVETALHKLHELGFPLSQVHSATGVAPLCPPTPDFTTGIGRTNDAILYGARVNLWIDGDDDEIVEVGQGLPSAASRDYGRPFAEIFAACEFDFYKIDPGLFSPAEVQLLNVATGRSWRFGRVREDLIASSFATEIP